MTKEELLLQEYSKLIGNPEKVYAQNPSIIKAAHSAMEKWGEIKWKEGQADAAAKIIELKGRTNHSPLYCKTPYKK